MSVEQRIRRVAARVVSPRVLDVAVAAGVVLYTLPLLRAAVPEGVSPWTGVAVAVGLCAPHPFRRTRPVASGVAVVAAGLVQLVLGIGFLPADLVVFPALHAVAARFPHRVSLSALGVVALGTVAAFLRWDDPYLGVSELVTALVLAGAVWLWGTTTGLRRAHVAALHDRAAALERERDDRARLAAAQERTRIAREMHDVVSHGLSVVVVLADGAAAQVHGDPDRAETAVRAIGDTGRTALAEMRRMLDVLRDDEPGPHAPQPGVAQLDRLLTEARAAGSPVELTVHGQPRELPPGVDLAVHRIVQEALTNARRHAGLAVTRVAVDLTWGADAITVRVADDGAGPPAHATAGGGGRGLVGMRERVAAYGGTLRTGPRDGGGFDVVAELPYGGAS